jgi:very-short-patch-repair endonuclease
LLSGFRMARCKSELEEELSRAAPLDDQAENLVALIEQKSQAIKDALPFLPATWAARVRDLSATLSELRREGSAKAKSAALRQQGVEAQNLIQLLPGLPLWACTLSSIPRAVPFVGGAFDLAIVDEAGQCNPASVLPLLFRAKRALFVGDPQQLRPVGSIARDKEDLLRRRHGLEGVDCSRFAFSGRSAFDLVADALIDRGVSGMRLREHYRCHPAIAAFFNSHFYGDDLIVRTSWREFSGQSGIKWTHVPGGSTTHQSSRWHAPQVESIVQELKELADNGFDGTVGVVTPFREQAKRIRDAAFAAIGARQAKKWEFIAETADKFQGGERDLVIFGLVGGGEGPSPTPPFYVRELNRFNVAVSRAKVLLHVFGDREWARKCEVEILRDLERRAHDNESEGRRPLRRNLIGPVWEPLLAETMRKQGLEFTQQYDTLGFYLDFAFLLEDGRKINVEVDGETYHRDSSGNLREEDVRRDLVLRANGWQVIRFWVYQLRDDLDSCILRIRKALRSP